MNSHHSRKHVWLALSALLLLPTTWVKAQGGASGAPTKLAVMNVREAIIATAEGKVASAQLQAQFAPQQNDLEAMQKQMQDLQSRLASGARTLSEDEKARLQRQGDMLSRQFQRKQDDLNEEVQAAQGDIVDTIGRKMLEVVDKYSRENGMALVVDTSSQGGSIVYGASQLDITQEIVRLYDQANPVRAGGAAESSKQAPPAAPAARPAKPSTAAPKKTTP